MTDAYLKEGLPQPIPTPDGLDAPFWTALGNNEIFLQKCNTCNKFQWGPEWICHRCHSDNLGYEQVSSTATIYSYERVWHPVHPALKEQGPYLVVLVEFPDADNVRVVGNLLGKATQEVIIGSRVSAVFEHHKDQDTPFTLLQWKPA